MEIVDLVILRIRISRSVNICLERSDFGFVTEQVENHLFRHRQDHFQKYDYAPGFLFALCNSHYPILSTKSTTERISKLAAWDPIFKYWRSSGSLRIPRIHNEAARVRAQGADQGQGPGPRPWAASFVVPAGPEAGTGSRVFEYGSQVANFENCCVVTAYTKILKQLQKRHGHLFPFCGPGEASHLVQTEAQA